MTLLSKVVPNGDLGIKVEVQRRGQKQRVLAAVTTNLPDGIVLVVDGDPRFILQLSYLLEIHADSGFLRVVNSTFKLYLNGRNRPLLTADFRDEHAKTVPVSHLNFHIADPELEAAIKATGRRGRRRREKREANSGELHFPTGGRRFRPALEDLLEFALHELGVDVLDGAATAIGEHRQVWRRRQLAAAVSDDPFVAKAELERMGYHVSWTNEIDLIPRPRVQRLSEY